jgi:hypothetical protein
MLGGALGLAMALSGCESPANGDKYTQGQIEEFIRKLPPEAVIDYAFANGTNHSGHPSSFHHNTNNTNGCLHRSPFDPTRPNQPGATVTYENGIYTITNKAGQSGYYEDENGEPRHIATLRLVDNGPTMPPTPADEETAKYMGYLGCNFDPYRE